MRRRLVLAAIFCLAALPAIAQVHGGGVQGGGMNTNASNAVLPDALTNLGLGTAGTPQFNSLGVGCAASGTRGQINIAGATSGCLGIQVPAVSGNGTFTLGLTPITDKTANYIIACSDTALTFGNGGATGEVDFTLPPITGGSSCRTLGSNGVNYCFLARTAQIFKIKASGTDRIAYGGTLSGAGGIVQPAASDGGAAALNAGLCIVDSGLVPPTTGNATWTITSAVGVLTVTP